MASIDSLVTSACLQLNRGDQLTVGEARAGQPGSGVSDSQSAAAGTRHPGADSVPAACGMRQGASDRAGSATDCSRGGLGEAEEACGNQLITSHDTQLDRQVAVKVPSKGQLRHIRI
jgi:hypothetical protein